MKLIKYIQKKQMQKNNKGFSLLELLIAMTILSIVAVAFYNSLVVSMRVNAKAKLAHKATTLAQEIVEGCKGENLESLLQQFAYPVYVQEDGLGNRNIVQTFDLLPQAVLPGAGQPTLASIYTNEASDIPKYLGAFGSATYLSTNDLGKTVHIKDPAPDKYVMYLQNAVLEQTAFDALIEVDSTPFQAINSRQIVQIPTMDGRYDAISSNSSTYDPEAVGKIKDTLASKGLGAFDYSNMTREIVLTIERKQAVGAGRTVQIVKEAYHYNYRLPGNQYLFVDDHNNREDFSRPSTFNTIFTNEGDETKDLRYIYLFFAPGYDVATQKKYFSDTIKVDYVCDDGLVPEEAQIFLIKQQVSYTTDVIDQIEDLQNYQVKVFVNVKTNDTAHATTSPVDAEHNFVHIRTNLGMNPSLSKELPNQALYYYNAANEYAAALGRTDSPVAGDGTADTIFDLKTLANEDSVQKMLKITVSVFEHVYDDAPGTQASFMQVVDDEGNPTGDNRKPLATFEGTIRN